MRTSIRTTSGRSSIARSTAARPSGASPTTSIVSSLESTAVRPARIRSSSSTRSTRTGFTVAADRRRRRAGDARTRNDATRGGRVEASAEQLPSARACRRCRGRRLPEWRSRGLGLVAVSSTASWPKAISTSRAAACRGARRWSAPPEGSGRRPGRPQARGAGGRPSNRTATARPEARWRSASVVERGEPGRRLDLAPVGGAVLAENADELVDLRQGLACDVLDRLERGSRSRRILLLQEACGSGLHEDDVDRVAGGVVQVAGDPGALLGGCEAPLALGLPLCPQRRAPPARSVRARR